MKNIKNDKNGAMSTLLSEIFMLFIVDLLGAYLITPLAVAITGAQGNLTDPGAQAMLGLVTMMFAIVLVVINVVVVMYAVKSASKKGN